MVGKCPSRRTCAKAPGRERAQSTWGPELAQSGWWHRVTGERVKMRRARTLAFILREWGPLRFLGTGLTWRDHDHDHSAALSRMNREDQRGSTQTNTGDKKRRENEKVWATPCQLGQKSVKNIGLESSRLVCVLASSLILWSWANHLSSSLKQGEYLSTSWTVWGLND